MSVPAQYSTDVLALYSVFVIGDPYCDAEEVDTADARAAAQTGVIAATQYHAYLQTAQQVTKVRLNLKVWDGEPRHPAEQHVDRLWQRQGSVTIECPQAQLIFDNVSAGPVDFQPGTTDRIDLPGGPGAFTLHVSTNGRGDINHLIVAALSVEPDTESMRQLASLGGHEQYNIDIWRTGSLSDDEDDE